MRYGLCMRDDVEPHPPTTGSFLTLFPSIMLPMFLAVVDQTIVATALPAIAASLGNIDRVSLVVVSYLVATTVAAPLYGQLRDTHGGKRMMLIALSVFLGASLLCALATSIEMLIVARVLQGLGGGGLMTLTQSLIGESVPPRERARYQGYLAAVMVTSSVFGPVVGGYLAHNFGWRSIFLINLPLGALAALLTLRLPQRPTRSQDWSFDGLGIVLFIIFIVPTLVALYQAQEVSLDRLPALIALVAVGVAALVMLVRHERQVAFPLFPLALLRQPTIWRSDALAACHGAALVSMVTFLPLYLHIAQGVSAAGAGLLLLPLMFGIGTGSMVTGRTVSRTGYTTIFPSVGLIVATILLICLGLLVPSLSHTQLAVLLFCTGLSMGTVMGVVQVTVQSAAGVASLGSAAASVQLSRALGAAFGTALVGTVLFAVLTWRDAEAAYLFGAMVREGQQVVTSLPVARQAEVHAVITGAFRAAFLAIAGFTAMGVLLAWTIPARRLS
jgi:EmrB/QacA subfamily drug resistance transporter